MIPSIGRIVHYILASGEHRPAIIVRVWDSPPRPESMVQLQVFTDSTNDNLQSVEWRTSVHHDGSYQIPGTWHWPEKV